MKTCIALIAVTVIFRIGVAHAEEKTLPRFYLDYAVVQHSLMNDQGLFDELMDIAEKNRPSADFIAEFWWSKANTKCQDVVHNISRRYGAQITAKTSLKEKETLRKAAKKEADQCFYGVYYDNWDAINRMIKAKHQSLVGNTMK